MMNQRQYLHMIQRMQADLVSTQINANQMIDGYKQKIMIMEEETDKHRQALYRRLQAQHRLEDFMIMIEEEHHKRTERV
jgi:hypothetical protein